MNTSVSVYEGLGNGGLSTQEYAKNVAYVAAQLMQYAGLESVSVGFSSDAMSRTTRVSDFKVMDFAPQSVRRLAPFFADAVAKTFSAAGIVSLSLDLSSESDRASISSMWDRSGMSSLRPKDSVAPQQVLIEPPGTTDRIERVEVGSGWSGVSVD